MHEPPAGWARCSLGDVAEECIGRNSEDLGSGSVFGVFKGQGLRPMKDRVRAENLDRYKRVERGWFAFNPMRINIGSIARNHGTAPVLVSPDYVVFRCREDRIAPDFLDQVREGSEWTRFVENAGQGSVRVRIYFDALAKLPLMLPPLAEQRKIAAILSSVDEAIEKTEAVIAQLDVAKKAMLEELLTRGIPGRHGRFKQTEIGEVPADWDVITLGEACEFLDSQRVPIKASDRTSMRGSVPYFGASGIVDWVNAHLFDEPLVLLSEDGANILTRSTPVAFKVSGKSWVNNHAHVLRPLPGWDHDFLVEFLESLDYADYSTGTAQPKLNKQTCLGIPVPMAPLSEQGEIGAFVRSCNARLTAERAALAEARNLKAALASQLLTGEMRVAPTVEAT